MKLSETILNKDETLKINFTITNTGKVVGEEVVQLYIQDTFASVVRPVKELKDFAKVKLKPGESKEITFELAPEKLSFYHEEKGWIVEAGEFKIMIGAASDNIKLNSLFELRDR